MGVVQVKELEPILGRMIQSFMRSTMKESFHILGAFSKDKSSICKDLFTEV